MKPDEPKDEKRCETCARMAEAFTYLLRDVVYRAPEELTAEYYVRQLAFLREKFVGRA